MKILKSVLGLAAVSLFVVMMSCNETKSYTHVDQMIAAAKGEVSFITPAELMAIMDSGDIVNIIDVREPREFNYGYIPGATNIPRGVIEFRINSEEYWEAEGLYLPEKDELFVLVCKKGGRSALAAKSIQSLGFKNVKVIKEGWKNWELTYPEAFEKNLDEGSHEEEEEVGGC